MPEASFDINVKTPLVTATPSMSYGDRERGGEKGGEREREKGGGEREREREGRRERRGGGVTPWVDG